MTRLFCFKPPREGAQTADRQLWQCKMKMDPCILAYREGVQPPQLEMRPRFDLTVQAGGAHVAALRAAPARQPFARKRCPELNMPSASQLGSPLLSRLAAHYSLAQAAAEFGGGDKEARALLHLPSLMPRRSALQRIRECSADACSAAAPNIPVLQAVLAALAVATVNDAAELQRLRVAVLTEVRARVQLSAGGAPAVPGLALAAQFLGHGDEASAMLGGTGSAAVSPATTFAVLRQTCRAMCSDLVSTPALLLVRKLWSQLQRRKPSGLGVLVATASALDGAAVVAAIADDAHASVPQNLAVGDVIESVQVAGAKMSAFEAAATVLRTGGTHAAEVTLRVRRDVGGSPAEPGAASAAAASSSAGSANDSSGEAAAGACRIETCALLDVPVVAMPGVATPSEPSEEQAHMWLPLVCEAVARQLVREIVLPKNASKGRKCRQVHLLAHPPTRALGLHTHATCSRAHRRIPAKLTPRFSSRSPRFPSLPLVRPSAFARRRPSASLSETRQCARRTQRGSMHSAPMPTVAASLSSRCPASTPR